MIIKFIKFLLLLLLFNSCFASDADWSNQTADAWKIYFTNVVKDGDLNSARPAAKIGLKNFTKNSFWISKDFQIIWSEYLKQDALSKWSLIDNGQSLFLLSDDENKSLLGIISNTSKNGSVYWLSITKPESSSGFQCLKSGCDIILKVNNNATYKIKAQPTTDSNDGKTESIGIKLSDIPPLPLDVQFWKFYIYLPDGKIAEYNFNMSFSGNLKIVPGY